MSKNEEISIRAVFSAREPAWTAWFNLTDKVWPEPRLPKGAEVARALRNFLNVSGSPAKLVSAICDRFGISDATSGVAERGQGWVRVTRSYPDWFNIKDELLIKAGPATAKRRQSVLAHEIAHLFLLGLVDRLPALERGIITSSRSLVGERFCWDFALELFCPLEERGTWTEDFVHNLLSDEEEVLCTQLAHAGLHRLSYWHIRSLARHYRISIRAVIGALDRHSLLDALECGIAVFRHVSNQRTGREVTLRVWQHARPTWGHVVSNQRAIKQGFRFVGDVYEEGKNQVTVVYDEELQLPWRIENSRVRWPRHVIHAPCAYTPVDVSDEGRYVVAIWLWTKPPGKVLV